MPSPSDSAGRGRPTPARLDVLLERLRPRLSIVLGDLVELRYELTATRAALIDLDALEPVVLNLALNAREAMPIGGTVTFRTEDVDVAKRSRPRPVGCCVALSVIDTGTGMTPEVLASATDPFFTTKPAGQGAGLGLSTADGIVRDLGGLLSIESAFGGGTRIAMRFPALPPTA